MNSYLLAMPRAPLLTGNTRIFGQSELRRRVSLWRKAEVSIPIRVLAVPTVFKTVLRAVAINLPYNAEVVVLCAVPYGALQRLLRFSFMALPITRYIIWRNAHQQLHSLLRDFHLLYRGCYDSWREKKDLNLRTISRLTR